MPARRHHTTRKARECATREKNNQYYQRNKNEIRAKRRAKYAEEIELERRSAKAKTVESKKMFWEAQAQTEYKGNTLVDLRSLEDNINKFICNSGSAYLERIFQEYLVWTQSDHQHKTESPLELPYKVFNSMMDAVAKVGNGILNEYGARKEWKECQ
ncbi:hypothetical protein AAF712_016035 [Marasmius tenuissimus]|uniref:BZIP domain-containing protein n=1 Tax=Marasmius tenuissimus TaxID=585030 RepID=A0ABR2Z7S6_9AGAR